MVDHVFSDDTRVRFKIDEPQICLTINILLLQQVEQNNNLHLDLISDFSQGDFCNGSIAKQNPASPKVLWATADSMDYSWTGWLSWGLSESVIPSLTISWCFGTWSRQPFKILTDWGRNNSNTTFGVCVSAAIRKKLLLTFILAFCCICLEIWLYRVSKQDWEDWKWNLIIFC